MTFLFRLGRFAVVDDGCPGLKVYRMDREYPALLPCGAFYDMAEAVAVVRRLDDEPGLLDSIYRENERLLRSKETVLWIR